MSRFSQIPAGPEAQGAHAHQETSHGQEERAGRREAGACAHAPPQHDRAARDDWVCHRRVQRENLQSGEVVNSELQVDVLSGAGLPSATFVHNAVLFAGGDQARYGGHLPGGV